jgi:hypothetical protein
MTAVVNPRLAKRAAAMKVERGRKQEREAIAAWLEGGAKRPADVKLDVQTYLAVARLIREGWHRR